MKLFSKKLVMDGDKTGEGGLDDKDRDQVEGGGKEETEEPCCMPVFNNLRHLMKVRIKLFNRSMTCVHHLLYKAVYIIILLKSACRCSQSTCLSSCSIVSGESQTGVIDCHSFLSRVRISVWSNKFFICEKTPKRSQKLSVQFFTMTRSRLMTTGAVVAVCI